MCILLNTFFAHSQWVQQTSGVTTGLLDLTFVNENTGWASGDNGVIVKTTNGGLNWDQQVSGTFNRLEGIHAVDTNIVYSVGWFETILKTTDGGCNWVAIRNGTTNTVPSFFKCFFLNANTGWLLGNNYILRTSNGGASFDSTYTIYSYIYDVFFKDALTGVLCGDGALIMKSNDGGITWNQIPIPLATQASNLYRLSFVGNYGWTVGAGGLLNEGRHVWRTTDFGNSWDSIARVPYPTAELNYSVYFTSINTGYCGGTTGYIFKTTNGGINWLQQNSPSNGFRRDFWFTNDSIGWCSGGGGQIYKTTNGGTYVSVETISSKLPVEFELYQNYPNPFNGHTVIRFDLLRQGVYKMEVYDIIGRRTEILFNEFKKAGIYRLNFDAENLSSGIYVYRLSSEKYSKTKKFILLK